jgi:hypothetical protein
VPLPDSARREIDNVAAFARLYGVVRYFCPADAVTTVDWDRLTVLGVSRARGARDAAELETALKETFGPLGPGLQIGKKLPPVSPPGPVDAGLVVWEYSGPAVAVSARSGPYSRGRTNRSVPAPVGEEVEAVSLSQAVPATDFRGKRIRYRARARVTAPEAEGWARLWLQIYCEGGNMCFVDNMGAHPIRETEWREYILAGPVAGDATRVVLGVLAAGTMTADFDAVELAVGDGETWTPIALRNPGFEAAEATAGWGQGGTTRGAKITQVEGGAAEGQHFLRLLAMPSAEVSPNTRAARGTTVDVDLGRGLRARVPLALSDEEARSSTMESLRAALDATPATAGRADLNVRLADVVVAWNVFRHFYPYWEEAQVGWDSRLVPQLEAAYIASTPESHREAVQLLVADIRDGHGTVSEPSPPKRGSLPIQLRVIGGRLVASASSVADAPVGTVVTALNGIPASERLQRQMTLFSGTTQWRSVRAIREMTACAPGSTTRLTTETAAGTTRDVDLACDEKPPKEVRPEPVSELAEGLWYVDLSRATMREIEPALPELAAARGVVFDLRGYPTDAGARVLPHLLDEPETDRWMHVAEIAGPFGKVSRWESFGWNMSPETPRLAGRRVFLTDGRAISYAESVMGYVKDRGLATIVGAATAGANGNVVAFGVPSGLRISFTGMRVTGHDGSAPHHLVGVQPDVPLEPTLAGLRAGKDELLEKAKELLGAEH